MSERKVLCSVCRKYITKSVQFECLVCPGFVQCLNCFNAGKVVPPHKKGHRYRVRPREQRHPFESEWTFDDELALLDAMERNGMGNWKNIGKDMCRDGAECKRHYHRVFLQSPDFPLPSKPKDETITVESDAKKRKVGANDKVETRSASSTSSSSARNSDAKSKSKLIEIAGYMPKRGDFDIEYDNDAEQLLADLEFDESDSPEDEELKLKMLDIYNQKLNVREQMKKIVLDHGLLDFKRKQQTERRRSKAERQIYNAHRCFARFWSAEEHEAYMQGLTRELNLRQRIAKLQHYRENGIRSLEEIEAFEKVRQQKELYPILDQKRDSAVADAATTATSAAPTKSSEVQGGKQAPRAPLPRPVVDPARHEGFETLPEAERRLCQVLQLMPDHFARIKAHIRNLLPYISSSPEVSPSATVKMSKDVSRTFQIEIHKVDRLFDFFITEKRS